MRTALIGGVLIDGSGGPPLRDATLVIEGSKIADVGHQRAFGPEVRVVDLGGRTVMPGLIDCHIHFAHWGMNLIAYQGQSLMLLAAETIAALRTTLEAGCTTARDLGGLDAGFREAVAGASSRDLACTAAWSSFRRRTGSSTPRPRRGSRRRSSPACPGRNATVPTAPVRRCARCYGRART